MVKNQGGNKGKKIAAKHMFHKIRLATEGEVYAVVTKMLGNCRCHVVGLDGHTLMCIIRKKFTGKHRQLLQPGTWVLVGLRDWETPTDKLPKCDLLECYSEQDKQIIGKQSDLNVDRLIQEEKKMECDEDEEPCEIIFSDI
jgi:initiation factor 1A